MQTAVVQSTYNRGSWNPAAEVSNHCSSFLEQRQNWMEILVAHCRALHQLTQGNSEAAFVQIESIVLTYTKVCEFCIPTEILKNPPSAGLKAGLTYYQCQASCHFPVR